jgi:hypothetical protein
MMKGLVDVMATVLGEEHAKVKVEMYYIGPKQEYS